MLFVLCLLANPLDVWAYFFADQEQSSANTFVSSSLNLGLTSDDDNFEKNDEWYPGSSAERSFTVTNEGAMDFVYGFKYASASPDILCDEIKLQVLYEGEELYNDALSDFDISYVEGDARFGSMVVPFAGSGHTYDMKVWLPIETEDDFAGRTCEFDITAYAWQEELEPYTGYWDDESQSSSIEAADWEKPIECSIGCEVFTIGDIESSQTDNPADELNWPGEFGVFPPYEDPFIVGTTSDKDFPWNSNYNQDQAVEFDIDFFYPYEKSLAKLTISWAPGRSSDLEQKEVYLDGDSVGTTPNRAGATVSGWWESMRRYTDEFYLPLEPGVHTITMKQLKGDGAVWDYIQLEIVGCSAEEGQVVINELMWSGSTVSSDDEWIEVYNDTGHTIHLDYWVLENAGSGTDLVFPEGSSISSHGYFLVSRFSSSNANSALSDTNVSVDWVVDGLRLIDEGKKITLKDAYGNVVDEADGVGGWPEGESSSDFRSMERNDDPDTGWHTCTDAGCNSTNYWDIEDNNYGTPRAENLSENDPSEKLEPKKEDDAPILQEGENLSLVVEPSAEDGKELEEIPLFIIEEDTTEGEPVLEDPPEIQLLENAGGEENV